MALDDQIKQGFQAVAADIKNLFTNRVTSATITTIWTGTQAQYDAIVTKDPATLYYITGA